MILGEHELTWQNQVTAQAHRHGWTVYAQSLPNQRQALPSLVLVRERLLLVFLRTAVRPGRMPDVDGLSARLGAHVMLWTPGDSAALVAELVRTDVRGA